MHIHFIQHVAFEYPGSILDWAVENNYTTSYTKTFEDAEFPQTGTFDFLVILGGPMGVYEEDKYSWMKAEKAFVKSAIDANKKVLGVCLGSQFIANVLGEEVYSHTLKEIGWLPVNKVAEHPLTNALPDEFITFHWHGDTFALPNDTVQLFRSAGCEQQGFVYGNHVAGLQFHMEVKEDLLNGMTENERSELIPAQYVQSEEIINSYIKEQAPKQKAYMKAFLDAFIKL